MWQYTSLVEPAEPTHILQLRPAGKRTLTAALQRRAAPAAGDEQAAAAVDGSGGAPAPLDDPFWFAGAQAPAADRLPAPVQRQMEDSFGADFSDVRIGVGGEARSHGALAFARGNELQFAPGQYDPTSTAGLELIGHELAHVVQQRQGRATSAQSKGGVVDDAALEAEADSAGARAARGQPAGLGASSASLDASAPMQRKTPIGIVKDVAGKSLSHELLMTLVTQHGIEQFVETIERSVLWWADGAIQSMAQKLLDLVVSASIWEAASTFAAWINPYLAVLETLRSIYLKLPEVVQTVIAFGIGSGMARLLGYLVGPGTADGIVNTVFMSGGSFLTKITWASKQLYDIAHTPASWAYDLAWKKLRGRFSSSAPTPAVYGLEEALGSEGQRDGSGAEQSGADQGGPDKAKALEQSPLLKKDLRYLWLEIDQPALARFDHDGRKSGGLELPFQFGVNLFNTRMQTRSPQKIQLPWSGGFSIELADLAIDAPAQLPPVFSIGEVVLTKVRVTDTGLEDFAFVVKTMSFGEDAARLRDVTAVYSKSAGLRFSGGALLDILGTKIDATGLLDLDSSGNFKEAELKVTALDRFTLIPDILVMESPGFLGKVTKGGDISLSLSSDLDSRFSIFDISVKGAHLDYHKGKGHELAGGIKNLNVTVGKHVTLSGKEAVLDRRGLRAAELALIYQHDPKSPDRAKNDLSTIGGISPELLSFTGITSLTIGGKVLGLRIGPPPRPVSVEDSQVALPRPEAQATPRPDGQEPSSEQASARPQGQARAQASEQQDSRFHVDGVQPILSKIGASAFGIDAELDLDNRKASLGGRFDYEPPMPEAAFEWHFLPGLAVFGALAPSVKLGATVKAGAQVPRTDAFELEGDFGASAELKLTAKFGAQVGSQLVAALRAGVFAEGSLKVEAKAGARGVLLVDRQARRVRASDTPAERPRITYSADAAVKASVGLVVSGHAFLLFNRELYRYTFKEWEFGLYHLEGEIDLDGKPKLDTEKSGFTSGKPTEPAYDRTTIEEARALLRKGLAIEGSAEERRKLLEEVRAQYKAADVSTYERLQAAQTAAEKLEEHYNDRRIQMAERAPSGTLDRTDLLELEMWKQKMQQHAKAVEAASASHRELQLVLVKGDGLTNQALEAGELDLEKLEASIRAAAERADQQVALTRQTGAAVGGAGGQQGQGQGQEK